MDSFDLRQGIMTFSLLEITNRFKQMETGEAMEIIGSDAGMLADLERVLSGREYEMTEIEEMNDDNRGFRLQLIKK